VLYDTDGKTVPASNDEWPPPFWENFDAAQESGLNEEARKKQEQEAKNS
jgi:hypothetical protein